MHPGLSVQKRGARDGAVVRALTSHQCGRGSNPSIDAICGLSFLLVLLFAKRGFCLGTLVFPSPQKPMFGELNSNLTRNQVDEEPLCGCATWIIIYIIYKSNHKLTLEVTAFVMGNQVPVRRTERIHFDCWCILYGVLLAFYDGPKEKHLGDNLFTATQTPVTAQFFFSWRTSSFLSSLSQWERVQASHHVML